jgi:hypothetical protein
LEDRGDLGYKYGSVTSSRLLVLIAACAGLMLPAAAAQPDPGPGASVAPSAEGGDPAAAVAGAVRRLRIADVDPTRPLPADFTAPEGKSRWDLRAVALSGIHTRRIEVEGAGVTVVDTADGAGVVAVDTVGEAGAAEERRTVYLSPDDDGGSNSDAARRWLLPDRAPVDLTPGTRVTLVVREERDGRSDLLRIAVDTLGIGWVDLPSGPRETVLQRALIMRQTAGRRGYLPERLVHRWVDPRAGVVAEISGPPTSDGRSRLAVDGASVADAVLDGAAALKLYVDEVDFPVFGFVGFGYDLGSGTTVASLTPDGHATIGDLIAADAWDFSGATSSFENASTISPITVTETCNHDECGYNIGGAFPNRRLTREDRALGTPGQSVTNAVTEREQRAGDVTVWLRGGAQKEGIAGSLGTGEAHFCHINDDGVSRNPVPLFRFANEDANGWFMQAGDSPWVSAPFTCEQNLFNEVCGGGGTFSTLYAKACGTHSGTEGTAIVKGGVVTLPSGHTFNALLLRTVADFCVYLGSSCLFSLDEVRTVIYLWQVPHLGTVVRLMSEQNAADTVSFTTVEETDIKFGLFPPRAITVTGMTDTTVDLAWDPGLVTNRISDYRVYWGTMSGAGAPYAFDSVGNPAQASIAGTTATISGLMPGTAYFFTVTARSSFVNPAGGGPAAPYESILFPTQVSGDPAFVYPSEVQATTTGGVCIPTAEVTGVMVDHAAGGDIEICWDPSADPCLTGYTILGAASPESAANYSIEADVGIQTCWTGNPAGTFLLVVARGTGGSGPWGHYGQ